MITFNFDEFRLILKSTPKRSYIAKETIVKGKKVYKAGVTVLVGISANGFKFKPLVIGASKDPRCFMGINCTTLPVVYVNQASAWMTSEIFQTYFLEHIVPTLHEHFPGQKVEITLDSAKCHPEILKGLDNLVHVEFIPPHTTSLIQPCDQHVILSLKTRRRKLFLCEAN